jgi:hypothetical protein
LLVLNNARGNVGVRRECLAHSGCWLVKDRAQLPSIPPLQGGVSTKQQDCKEAVVEGGWAGIKTWGQEPK